MSPLPEQAIDHCTLKGGMPDKVTEGHRYSPHTGVGYQYGEIQNSTPTILRMARDTIQGRCQDFEQRGG